MTKLLFIFLVAPLVSMGQAEDTTFKHVYHLKRLQVITADTTVTGTVTRVTKEIDGDYHVVLDSKLEVEFICQLPSPRVPDATAACIGYGQIFARPKKGDNITVSGPYVMDGRHGWREIHPAVTLKINNRNEDDF